jgi:hypothetical protein
VLYKPLRKSADTNLCNALDGNVTMLIWLGKQYLGQGDQAHLEIDVTKLSEEGLEAIVRGEMPSSQSHAASLA